VIEGFYGRTWTHADRLFLIEHLPALGLDAYLYAPKADASLRREWQRPWTSAEQSRFRELTAAGEEAGTTVAAGLSPFELYLRYDGPARRRLKSKTQQLVDSGIPAVALLFDDMPGDVADLALRQAEIVADVQHWIGASGLRVCPTYYSDDPVLDRVFGDRPDGYIETLARNIDSRISLFWTGPEVCSQEIPGEHLRRVSASMGRPVALWDNYPVNDSSVRSEHLYVQPFAGREVSADVESHWSNAMNQMALSLPALASLAHLYAGTGLAGESGNSADMVLQAAGITPALLDACAPLGTTARGSLTRAGEEALQEAAAADTLAARELRAWLQGAYVFDPACLTD
jgi:hypothetical protein